MPSVSSRIKKVISKWALFPAQSSLSLSKILGNISSGNSFLYNIIRITGFHTQARVTMRSFNSSPLHVSPQRNEKMHPESQLLGQKKIACTHTRSFRQEQKRAEHHHLDHTTLNTINLR